MENTNNQYALITGGTSGIGKELAKLFAQDGYNLIIVAREEAGLGSTKSEIAQRFGVQVETISKDLFEPNAAEELYDEIKEKGITVNVLVNDAGQGQHGKFAEYDVQRDIDIIQLNIISLTVLTKLYLKDMLARNEGKILQLSSLASKTPGPLLAVYSATKAYVQSFTQAIINEIKDTNVTMTALLPGATDTDFFNKADAENTKQAQDMKLDDPADVAKDGYKALMSGEAKVVSGFKNKVMAAMTNIMPEQAGAGNMRKTMEESDSEKNKTMMCKQKAMQSMAFCLHNGYVTSCSATIDRSMRQPARQAGALFKGSVRHSAGRSPLPLFTFRTFHHQSLKFL